MLNLFFLILFCTIIAFQIGKISFSYNSVLTAVKKNWSAKTLYFLLLTAVILFSGLRTGYNDTSVYMHTFSIFDSDGIKFSTLFEPYGGFDLFQYFIKKYISNDPQALLIISAIIVNVIYLWFFSKHSKNFGLTILSYFVIGPYLFSMAGMKQIIAMSISLLAIDNMLQNKYSKFVMFLLLASTFHPYIVCLLIIPFFKNGLFDRKSIFTVAVAVLLTSNLELLLKLAVSIGKNYTVDLLTNNTINPMRVVCESIPIIILFINRKILQTENNPLLNLGGNMLLVNAILIFMGLFFNPIYFGRIATYFASFSAITIPLMLNTISLDFKNRTLNILVYYVIFIIYFILDLTKLGTISLNYDLYKHINLFQKVI
jgi:transmembrane protein EpsG